MGRSRRSQPYSTTVPGSAARTEPAAGKAAPVDLHPGSVVGAVVTVLVLLLAIAVFRAAATAITYVVIGVLLALAMNPIVVRLARRMPRGLATFVVAAALALAVGVLMIVVAPAAINQARQFGRELPETLRDMYRLPLIGDYLRDHQIADTAKRWIDELPARVDSGSFVSITESVTGAAAGALAVILTAFAVLFDGERLVARGRALVPRRFKDRADKTGRVFAHIVGEYFAGSLTVAALAGLVVLCIGLVFGVPLAPVAALWAMVVNPIPQIGGFLTGLLFVPLALSESATTGVACGLLYVAYMNLENHVITPAIVGEAVNLSPLTTMLAVLIGGAAAGVPGALVATPLCGTVKALYKEARYGPGAANEARERREGVIERFRKKLGRDS